MRRLFTPIVLLTLLFPLFASGATKIILEKRDGLWYEKSSDVPFTGEVDGIDQGSFKDGKREGPWIEYSENGQVFWKRTYKDGKLDGPSVTFHEDGRYAAKQNYKDGTFDGPYELFYENGQQRKKTNYKDGKIDGPYVSFYDNGQLEDKGNYKDGLKEGPWVFFNKDGIKRVTKDKHGFDEGSGTYRNGKKISD